MELKRPILGIWRILIENHHCWHLLLYVRPTKDKTLLGDLSKAKEKLGWVPEITLQEMCKEMATHDLEQAKQHALLKQHEYAATISSE
jgi:GDPmannose 4,6-dehydratase